MESKLLIRHHVQQVGILLSSSGRHRFWHIHCILTPKLIIYSFLVAVQQWLSISNPSELSLQQRSRSARDQFAIVLEWHALATHAGTRLSFGHFQDSGFMDIGDTASLVG